MPEAWSFEHTLECPVPREFAWRFWSTVSNWKLDSDVEAVELSGPFEAGAIGTTVSRRSGRIEWRVVSVEAPERAAIALPEAAMLFQWQFLDAGGKTRFVQRISLSGEQALAIAEAMGSEMERSVPAGMQKLSDKIVEAARLES